MKAEERGGRGPHAARAGRQRVVDCRDARPEDGLRVRRADDGRPPAGGRLVHPLADSAKRTAQARPRRPGSRPDHPLAHTLPHRARPGVRPRLPGGEGLRRARFDGEAQGVPAPHARRHP